MPDNRNIFITGNSSGIGYGLTEEYLECGWDVYGISRRGCIGLQGLLHDIRCNLTEFAAIAPALQSLLDGVERLDLVVLNAGVLGEIREMNQTSMKEIKQVMDINLWANKVVMDWLHASKIQIHQIVFMSSGAAINGNKGWSGYALSKAALNMMAKLYVHEFPDTHISAFAPGLVHTRMLDDINNNVDTTVFPTIQGLKDAIGSPSMPEPRIAGGLLANAFERLLDHPSGSFLDIRTMQNVGRHYQL